MIHIWRTITDICFPPSPALITLRQYDAQSYHHHYEPRTVENITILCRYQSPLIKACITAGKFEHNIDALKDIGQLLHRHLTEHTATYPPANTLLTAIPLHPKRECERGYNQVQIIIDAARAGTAYRTCTLLDRSTNTTPQSHLKRSERLTHVADAFRYRAPAIDWRHITQVILVDDVMTTGSTLKAAYNTLAPALPKGVKLHVVAIAH